MIHGKTSCKYLLVVQRFTSAKYILCGKATSASTWTPLLLHKQLQSTSSPCLVSKLICAESARHLVLHLTYCAHGGKRKGPGHPLKGGWHPLLSFGPQEEVMGTQVSRWESSHLLLNLTGNLGSAGAVWVPWSASSFSSSL